MKTAITPAQSSTAAGMAGLGERLRLARLRRGLQADTVSTAAGISRVTLFRIERGAPSVSMGAYAAVLEVLGLQGDLDLVAAQDALGRQVQDRELLGRRPAIVRAEVEEGAHQESVEDIWAFKRRNQMADLERVRSGRSTPAAMSWFTEEQAEKAQIVGEAL